MLKPFLLAPVACAIITAYGTKDWPALVGWALVSGAVALGAWLESHRRRT